jgi:Tfp pilus assembly protein FimV
MRSIEHAFDPQVVTSSADTPRREVMSTASPALSSTPVRRPSRPSAPARLTHRGRVVVVLLALLLLVVAGFVLGRVSSQAAGPSKPLPTVTVHAGETLWDIAARVAPHADRRALVLRIEALNGLPGGRVVVGQQLRLPR